LENTHKLYKSLLTWVFYKKYIKYENFDYRWKKWWRNMCSDAEFQEIKKRSFINLSEETDRELKETIERGERMSRENDELFRSMLL